MDEEALLGDAVIDLGFAAEDAAEKMGHHKEAIEENASAAARASETYRISGNKISGQLTRAFDRLIHDGDRFNDVVARLGRSLSETVFREAIEPVTDHIGGGIAGVLNSVLGFGSGAKRARTSGGPSGAVMVAAQEVAEAPRAEPPQTLRARLAPIDAGAFKAGMVEAVSDSLRDPIEARPAPRARIVPDISGFVPTAPEQNAPIAVPPPGPALPFGASAAPGGPPVPPQPLAPPSPVFTPAAVQAFAPGGAVSAPVAAPFRARGTGEVIPGSTAAPAGPLTTQSQAAPRGAAPVSVVMNISTPDAEGFRRSQSQIAAQMSRMLSRGQRNR